MRRTWIVASLVMLWALPARAQDSGSEEEAAAPLSSTPTAQQKPKYNEVEHGFFVGAMTGLALTLVPGGANFDGSKAGLATGQSGGVELGFEPIPALALGIIAVGSAASTSSAYQGTCDPAANGSCPHGNYTALTLGIDARLNLSLGADANDVRRTYFYVRAGAGYSILAPKGLLQNELLVFGGPGIEYYTHLRHFSIGIEADATYGLTNKDLAILIQPQVRYTF